MKLMKVNFERKIENGVSWIIYITKTYEEASAIHQVSMTHKKVLGESWYYSVSTAEARKDCRVPEFFHEKGYWLTAIGHNNGDWNKAPKYELYIVD